MATDGTYTTTCVRWSPQAINDGMGSQSWRTTPFWDALRWCRPVNPRVLITGLMVSLLGMCPLLECRAALLRVGPCSVDRVQETAPCHATCHHDSQPPPNDHFPCDGQCNCICSGAVVPQTLRVPCQQSDENVLPVGHGKALMAARRCSPACLNRELCAGSHFPPDLAGRGILRWTSSLLL
jgi:hypothetical protein